MGATLMTRRLMTYLVAMAALLLAAAMACLALPAPAPAASTPADGRIVWTRWTDQNFSAARLVSANPDGGDIRLLTRSARGTYDIDPIVSPDGRRVVFERDRSDGSAEVVVVGSDGSNEHVVATGCSDPCAADLSPSWTPDGNHIAFSRVVGPFDRCGDSAASAVLYLAAADGSGARRLSEPGIDGEYEDYRARWAPDGSYIQFLRIRNCPYASAMFRMDADGGNVRQLTPWELDADVSDLSQARSGPTKDLVVFETYGHGGNSQDIATVPATCTSLADCTSRITYLTNNLGGPTQSTNPAWSPDGTRIAFAEWTYPWERSGFPHAGWHADIFTIDPNGGSRRQVSRSVHWEMRPDWGVTP